MRHLGRILAWIGSAVRHRPLIALAVLVIAAAGGYYLWPFGSNAPPARKPGVDRAAAAPDKAELELTASQVT
ncbi:hypothetical protein, partial [Escherichia coli]|uniref:hypothetical protein n=1 Tax=Escherichia coli TaxID=562 RepID=UPI0039E13993